MFSRGRHAAPRQKGKELRRFGRAIPLALVGSLVMATAAFASSLEVDANLGANGQQEAVSVGTNLTGGQALTTEIEVYVSGEGGYAMPVTYTATGTSGVITGAEGGSISVAGRGNGDRSTVSFTTPCGTGAFSGTVTFTGTPQSGSLSPNTATATITGTVTTAGTTGACAPTVAAPTVNADAVGTPNHVSGSDTFVTSGTQLGFTVTGLSLTACTISIDGPTTNDTSFACVAGSNPYTLGGKLTTPPDGSYLNSASATNAGGSGSDSFTVILDNTAPTLGSCTGGPFLLGSGNQAVSITADDGTGAGIDSSNSTLSGSVDTSTVGPKTVNYAAEDYLGNAGSTSCTYRVIFDWNGFFSPVDNLPTLNSAKAGQSIPVKFSLNGDQGLNIFDSDSPYNGAPRIVQIACPTGNNPDPIEVYSTTTANSKLIYDSSVDQYNYVWKTDKAWAGKCFQLDVKLIDGETHSAQFKFTK